LACALAAVKLHIPVAHVEAGLRSFDRKMPEEINRILTDAISDYLFTPSPDGDQNLLKEGISADKIFMAGDIMVDSLLFNLEKAKTTKILERLFLGDRLSTSPIPYSVLTLHRPSNVDNRRTFERIVEGLLRVSSRIPILCAMHPRTRKQVKAFGMEKAFRFYDSPRISPSDYFEGGPLTGKIHCFEPLPYLDFLNLMAHARIVFTDSGGIQEETTVLDIPCVTLRDTTERPITLAEGTNVLVHDDPDRIEAEAGRVLDGKARHAKEIPIWDGRTAERIVRILMTRFAS
jgi:UDP-N-acetylglucosamine 2-epimerase (non-hydrolysing)